MRALRARRDGNGHVQHLRSAPGFLLVRLAAEEEPGDGQARNVQPMLAGSIAAGAAGAAEAAGGRGVLSKSEESGPTGYRKWGAVGMRGK